MTDKQTPLAPMAQDANVQSGPAADAQRKADAEKAIQDGNATIGGNDPAGKQVSPKLEGATTAEVPSTAVEGLDPHPRRLDNGVSATLPEGTVIGPDSPHDNPMAGTNQVNPSAESVVAAGGALDPTARQQPLSAGHG